MGGSSGLWYICPDLPREPESNFGNKAESSNLYLYKTILILLYNSYKLYTPGVPFFNTTF